MRTKILVVSISMFAAMLLVGGVVAFRHNSLHNQQTEEQAAQARINALLSMEERENAEQEARIRAMPPSPAPTNTTISTDNADSRECENYIQCVCDLNTAMSGRNGSRGQCQAARRSFGASVRTFARLSPNEQHHITQGCHDAMGIIRASLPMYQSQNIEIPSTCEE